MSKNESLDSASQAGWFLHLGPVRCGTIWPAGQRGAVRKGWWARLFYRGPREIGVANPTFQNYSSSTSTTILMPKPILDFACLGAI